MSRRPATGLRAARPAATSWFLLTLTALAAFLSSGLEVGGLPDSSTRLVSSAGSSPAGGAPDGQTDRRAEARLPFVGAVLAAAPSPAGPPADLATSGSAVLLGAPSGRAELVEDSTQWTTASVVRRSGRAPPV